MNPPHQHFSTDRTPRWLIAERWREFEGEGRASLIRIVVLIAFYGVQLLQYYFWSNGDESDRIFHRQATAIAAAWLFVSLGATVALLRGFFPSSLKYIITAFDLILLTLLAWLGAGPSSPLVFLFFLIVVLSAIRFRQGLVWFATIGSMVCYWGLVGSADDQWFDPDHKTRPIVQAIVLLSLLTTGGILSQLLSAVRQFAQFIEDSASGRRVS